MKTRRIRNFFLLLAAFAIPTSMTGLAPATATSLPIPAPNKLIDEHSVGIQMFMYSWDSIAAECTTYMGPAGIDWVQVSPPQEHINGQQWWIHYQPVSYKIESNLGTRAQFANMVQKCNAAGVAVIVDAVINHMANSGGTGFAGSSFDKYDYPGIYGFTDFHAGLTADNPHFCSDSISDYGNAWQVVNCELGGLPDLATESTFVRTVVANYLNDLLSLGVAGFRVDAAKHFGSDNLQAVVEKLNPVNGRPPVIMSETIGNGVANADFVSWGSKAWAWGMPDLLANNMTMGSMAFGNSLNWTNDFSGSSNTITMVGNHDTEHHGPTSIAYWQGNLYQLAHVYMLAIPFGIPEIYTGYSFTDETDGPPTNAQGQVTRAKCPTVTTKPVSIVKDGIYTCVDRWLAIQGMIKWRDAAASSPQTHSYYRKFTLARTLTFARGSNWIAMNPTQTTTKAKYMTYLAKGTYCDVITGGRSAVRSNKTCVGTSVIVDAAGYATITVPSQGSIAIGAFAKAK
jgi:alpha-amylase